MAAVYGSLGLRNTSARSDITLKLTGSGAPSTPLFRIYCPVNRRLRTPAVQTSSLINAWVEIDLANVYHANVPRDPSTDHERGISDFDITILRGRCVCPANVFGMAGLKTARRYSGFLLPHLYLQLGHALFVRRKRKRPNPAQHRLIGAVEQTFAYRKETSCGPGFAIWTCGFSPLQPGETMD